MTVSASSMLRAAQERGRTRLDWLESYHTFSFGDYYDPRYMSFSDLRVINDDVIHPNGGFGMHGHRDMEIVTVVLSGALEHRDSLGNGSIIQPGEVQRMSAGTGVKHSEFNPSSEQAVHLLQIWIKPEKAGFPPGYEQRRFPFLTEKGRFWLVASPTGEEDSVVLNQDARLFVGSLDAEQAVEFPLKAERRYWLHVATGSVSFNEQTLNAGDAFGFTDVEQALTLKALAPDTCLLLFDLR